MATNTVSRRTELGAFLRSRRERRTPQEAGLPPGFRRRTPGLRREEVALLAGVGVTWYTWLEQGRPINASVQVLDAVARTLGMDPAERTHLYRLAQVPWEVDPPAGTALPEEVQPILDQLGPLPAAVYNSRFDVLAWNGTYARLFPGLVQEVSGPPNVLRCSFLTLDCCNPFIEREYEMPRLVAELHTAFGRHVGEPEWESFVDRLRRASPEFARLWARREVIGPARHVKRFRHAAVGELTFVGTRLTLSVPETRMQVYTPADEATRRRTDALVAMSPSEVPECRACEASRRQL
jgi:transcriptional regulator with XRE-family HTH domain